MKSNLVTDTSFMKNKYDIPDHFSEDKLQELIERASYLSDEIKRVEYDNEDHTLVIHHHPQLSTKISESLAKLIHSIQRMKLIAPTVLESNVDSIPSKRVKQTEKAIHAELDVLDESKMQLLSKIDDLIKKIGASRQPITRNYPTFLSDHNLKKNKYHIHFPQNIVALYQMPHDYTLIESVRQKNNGDHILHEHMKSSGGILRPCICYHVYEELEHSSTDSAMYSSAGTCFRNEVPWKLDAFRKKEFNMREFVVVGSEEEVKRTRNEMIQEVWSLFNYLGLEGKIESATDPFFFSGDMNKITHQLMAEAKYELKYKRQNGSYSSIASFNFCGDHLCDAYDITHKESGQHLYSGCIAFGLNRWMSAIIDYYGEDPAAWPIVLQ
ncbi:aminoacyl--tRNA ligase-related protein [Longirhabdus pacifica]|uniref:aminoacyl--tRNA ligase-related protein n=1 Tax=Longirhabdus pacifica TaxID=2305227 RepID=UPI001008EF58|nr:aminoacyl--tRNA ligase-related protein [Longirhabdus pacifica]